MTSKKVLLFFPSNSSLPFISSTALIQFLLDVTHSDRFAENWLFHLDFLFLLHCHVEGSGNCHCQWREGCRREISPFSSNKLLDQLSKLRKISPSHTTEGTSSLFYLILSQVYHPQTSAATGVNSCNDTSSTTWSYLNAHEPSSSNNFPKYLTFSQPSLNWKRKQETK